jgi:2-methylcitrate dehydratase PrpD
MSGETIAQTLARWVTDLKYEALTPEAVFQAKRCMLDTLGVQLRGATLPWVLPVYRGLRTSGGDEAAVSYYGDRLSAPYAAYVNSAFSYACELQHHGPLGSAHVGVVVGPAVQALGEKLGSSGRDIITAMVAGYEVQGRLGVPSFEAMSEHHFHPQGVLGVFGAAAAAGKLLGLNAEQQAHAFAIAGSHASTVLEYDQSGGEVKRIHGAIAARSGMQSAILAKEGLTGPLTIFEGRRGIFASFAGGKADPGKVLPGIGNPFCITRCRFRIYPTIGSCHAVLDIVNDLMAVNSFDYRDVQSIKVGLWEFSVMHATTIKRPHDVISAQACLGYSLGLRLVKGGNDLDMYMDPELWRDPEVLSVADKLEAYVLNNPDHPQMSRVEIKLKDGRVLQGEMADARGTEDMPFSQEVIETKFRRLAGAMLPEEQVNQIVQSVNRLEELPSLSVLVPLLRRN